MRIPPPRGPVSLAVAEALGHGAFPRPLDAVDTALDAALDGGDVLYDDDLQLALFCLYELHYSGLEGVDERWEWHPPLLAVRQRIEAVFEARLREATGPAWRPVGDDGDDGGGAAPGDVAGALFALAEGDDGPSVSTYLSRHATREQALEFLVLKSVYQLKEADPHTWAVPRLSGGPKSALVEIQADEYGGGRPGHTHAELFARTMAAAGLDPEFGAYVDRVPALALASVNAISLFGLQRRLRGAVVGHLAIFEATSSIPNARYSKGFARLGFGNAVTDYFDEHVEADAVHEQIAVRDLAAGLVRDEPALAADVHFGAATVCHLDRLLADWQLGAWSEGRSALRQPLPALEAA